MGRSVVYCPICGGPFDDVSTGPCEGDWREDVLPPSHTEWLASFRVIGKAAFTKSQDKDNPAFAISPPASEAESRSVYINDTDPASSDWACMNGTKWSVFDQNDDGIVLYPLHDACILFIQKMAHLNLQRTKPESRAKHTSLKSYYETLIRGHKRLTEFPYGDSLDEQRYTYEPWHSTYGSFKLEYHHGYYGASRFTGGSTWYMETGWEWLCADFINILGLTSYILRHLRPLQGTGNHRQLGLAQPIPTSVGETVSVPPLTGMPHETTSTLESVPTEIIKQIVCFLPVTATLALRCCSKSLASKVSLDQIFWRDRMIAGDLVSWLWDLDVKECHAKDRIGSWDWEQLAQTLRQVKIFESALKESTTDNDSNTAESIIIDSVHETDVIMKDAPLGLQNRCRLAKLVKDIESDPF